MPDLTHYHAALSPADALRPLRCARLTRLLGKAMTAAYRLAGRHRYDDFRLERVHGTALLVIPSVFNPRLPRTGAFLASVVDSKLIPADAEVLDMGSGSGVCALIAARHARRVVAVDINAAAVRCTTINAMANDLADRIEVRQGDLFEPVAGERFDLILFNPPFLRGVPRDDRDRAWRSPDLARRFAAGLTDHLTARGCALVVLSTFGSAQVFLDAFRAQGLGVAVLCERRFATERLAIFRLEPR
ncbi:MAG: methyltransferase [Proteobacteria bacterium]|nr:methyltransferase [Pseudomonadota bacterium]